MKDDNDLTLILFDTGSHSYLFNSKRLRKGRLK